MKRYVLIVGLQKSGTNLLVALLEKSGLAKRVGSGMEGGPIGQQPAFAPDTGLGGEAYQLHGGSRGHAMGLRDASPAIIERVRRTLEEQVAADRSDRDQIGFSKSPYNAVRLPFLRVSLPDAFIVAVVRRAVPNCYSLWKRYQPNSGTSGPVEGWWGVKPIGWRHLLSEDKLEQSARQWDVVNSTMLGDRPDLVVWYHNLCARPAETVRAIYRAATGDAVALSKALAPLRCCDDEATESGSDVRPKYQTWKDTGDLQIDKPDNPPLPPLTSAQQSQVSDLTQATEDWATRWQLTSGCN